MSADVLDILRAAPLSWPEFDDPLPRKLPAASKIVARSVKQQYLKQKHEQRQQRPPPIARSTAALRFQRDVLRGEVLKRARLQKAQNNPIG